MSPLQLVAPLLTRTPEAMMRAPLTTDEAQRGVQPERFTRAEWDAMNAASRRYHDDLQRAAVERSRAWWPAT